jgi:zinc protease
MPKTSRPHGGSPAHGIRDLVVTLGAIAGLLVAVAGLRSAIGAGPTEPASVTRGRLTAAPPVSSGPAPQQPSSGLTAPQIAASPDAAMPQVAAAPAGAGQPPKPPPSAVTVAPATHPAPRPTQAVRLAEAPSAKAANSVAPRQSFMKIQSVKSKTGIEAWLVEEHSVPLLALRFAFEGGNSQDPPGKEGVANFLTAMMDEGAGDLDHSKFQERMEELAFRMSFEDARDALYGNFETLTVNRAPSIEMLRLALNKPRFDAEAVERVRKQLLASLAFAAKKPDRIASKTWSAIAFPGHPYGRPAEGTPESIASITRDDLEAFRQRTFARDTLKVVAVGDITASELADLLDRVFGELPAKATLLPVPATNPQARDKLKVVEMDVPQSVVQFGMAGIARKDKDFLPAFILNQILGGGGFASRLTEEVREKRGLAYSVYSYLQPYRHVAIFGGGVATKNEEVAKSIDVIRSELKRMAEEGPTEAEFANAKSYLIGSFPLRFDTNAKIASQLLWMLQEDMGIDYVDKRNALIEAVTIEDVKRVAKRLLTVDDLIVTVVGRPKGLSPGG